MIENLVKILNSLQLPVKPLSTDIVEECIIYKCIPISSTGIVIQYRLEIRVIAFHYAKVIEISNRIQQLLITVGDNEKDAYKSCELNGGGILEDVETNTVHQLMYFNIITRSV